MYEQVQVLAKNIFSSNLEAIQIRNPRSIERALIQECVAKNASLQYWVACEFIYCSLMHASMSVARRMSWKVVETACSFHLRTWVGNTVMSTRHGDWYVQYVISGYSQRWGRASRHSRSRRRSSWLHSSHRRMTRQVAFPLEWAGRRPPGRGPHRWQPLEHTPSWRLLLQVKVAMKSLNWWCVLLFLNNRD